MTLKEFQTRSLPGIAPEDFFLLLAHATKKEKVFLLTHPEYELSQEEEKKAEEYLTRRLKHEPVALITGHKEFYGRDFRVTQDTLIPRPETELLVETALNTIFHAQASLLKGIDIIDIGTGSGNIIITLAKELDKKYAAENITYHALDLSPRALAVARDNAVSHHIDTRITFLKSDLLKNFSFPPKKNRHAMIVANLPYLSSKIYQASSIDVRDYEPQSALESGGDGLNHYRALFQILPSFSLYYLSTILFLEISPEQWESLERILHHLFPGASLHVFSDLSGKNRLVQAIL